MQPLGYYWESLQNWALKTFRPKEFQTRRTRELCAWYACKLDLLLPQAQEEAKNPDTKADRREQLERIIADCDALIPRLWAAGKNIPEEIKRDLERLSGELMSAMRNRQEGRAQ